MTTSAQEGKHPSLTTGVYDINIDFNSIVAVDVGDACRRYTVHEDLICHYSSWFRFAFKEDDVEGQEGRVRVFDCDCPTFDVFVKWVYAQTLPEWEKDANRQQVQALHLCKLYVFADSVGSPKLKKAIIDKYVAWIMSNSQSPGCGSDTVEYVYTNTHEASPLRQLIVDDFCCTYGNQVISFDDFWDKKDSPPAPFLLDLFRQRENIRSQSNDGDMEATMEAEDYYDDEVKESLKRVRKSK